MANYNAIRGRLVQSLSSDPSITSAYEGQVWYNSTSSLLKSLSHIKAFASGGNVSTGRNSLGGTGTQTATVVFGGNTSPPTYSNATEEYGGVSWTAGGNLGTARANQASAGTLTAGLSSGGQSAPTTFVAVVEEYDGSSWSEVNDLSTPGSRRGCGTQTAGLVFGGTQAPPLLNATEEYDGTNWTNGGNMNVARAQHTGCGIQTSALAISGGTSPSAGTGAVEQYDGSTWTTVSSINTTRYDMGSFAANADQAIGFGGYVNPGISAAAEEWDGSTWTTTPATLGTARYTMAGSGTATSGLSTSGRAGPRPTATEEYNSSLNVIVNAAWASGGAAPRGHAGQSMAGNHTDAMMWGGDTGGGYPGWTTTSHSYNGSSWSSEGSIPTGVSAGGQAGAGHTDAITWGGYKPAPNAATINKTYEYNGSSWTAGGDLNDNREYAYATGAGPQTACIAIGSGPGNSAEHENYNGTAWSEETDFPSGSNFVGTIGTQTATLGVSGSNGTTATWDGSSWTASPNTMITARSYGAAGGASSSEGYMFGGGPTDHRTFTEKFDGTSWTSDVSMANGRNSAGGSGVTSNSLIAGSYYPGNTAIEEYTAASSTLTASTITTS